MKVVVDRASWRAQPSQFRHPFPRTLARQRGPFPVHLRLRELTTPALNFQSEVATLWPLLRYLDVVADPLGFRFQARWVDADRHRYLEPDVPDDS